MRQAIHLSRRFFGSLRPGPPSPDDEAWALGILSSGERSIWAQMSNPDRRHAVAVARAVDQQLPRSSASTDDERPAILAAALLHDSGKVIAGLNTPARVVATLVWTVVDDARADEWLAETGSRYRQRLAQYRRHPELGGEMLRAAGSSPLTAAWAEEHHRPEARWSVPIEIGRILKACDDD